MGFTDFKNLSRVAYKFNCEVEKTNFIEQTEFDCEEWMFKYITKNIESGPSYSSEASICERIISPIINLIAEAHNLPVWSHVQLDVNKELDLVGTPDYLLAPALPGEEEYKLPIACIGEAKKDKFTEGWGQTASEMIAAQMLNKNKKVPIYGLVTNGSFWEFGKLEGNKLTLEKKAFSASRDLQEIFNVLNWFFCEASKSAEILLDIEAKELAANNQ